jgi:hypothetical protein
MPVSASRCVRAVRPVRRAAAAISSSSDSSEADSSTPAWSASSSGSPGVMSHDSTGAVIPLARSSRASLTKAVPSMAAPPASMASEEGTSPCP